MDPKTVLTDISGIVGTGARTVFRGGPTGPWPEALQCTCILKNYGVNKTNFKMGLQVQKSIMKFRDCNPYTHYFLDMFCLYIYTCLMLIFNLYFYLSAYEMDRTSKYKPGNVKWQEKCQRSHTGYSFKI